VIDPERARLSSATLGSSLTKLSAPTAERQNDEYPEKGDQNHFAHKSRYSLHHCSFSIVQERSCRLNGTRSTIHYDFIIQVALWAVN
jgi:hypothetical protein